MGKGRGQPRATGLYTAELAREGTNRTLDIGVHPRNAFVSRRVEGLELTISQRFAQASRTLSDKVSAAAPLALT